MNFYTLYTRENEHAGFVQGNDQDTVLEYFSDYLETTLTLAQPAGTTDATYKLYEFHVESLPLPVQPQWSRGIPVYEE